MQRQFRALLVLFGALLSTIVAAKGAGSQQRTLRAQLDIMRLHDCELPCWIGIVPGKTTMSQAQALLRRAYASPDYTIIADIHTTTVLREDGVYLIPAFNASPFTGSTSGEFLGQGDDDIILQIVLTTGDVAAPYGHYTIGDWVGQFGPPDAYYFNRPASAVNLYRPVHSYLFYAKLGVQLILDAAGAFDIKDESVMIDSLEIHAYLDDDGSTPWRGFSSFNRVPSLDQLLGVKYTHYSW